MILHSVSSLMKIGRNGGITTKVMVFNLQSALVVSIKLLVADAIYLMQ